MTLIVEDGTGVADANTYVTVAELRAFALLRAVALPADDADCEPLLVQASDWIDWQESTFVGVREFATQALSWPRVECYESLGVPVGVKKAQMFAALDAAKGFTLLPSQGTDSLITSEKVGDLAVTYKINDNTTPQLTAANGCLSQYRVTGFGMTRVNRA